MNNLKKIEVIIKFIYFLILLARKESITRRDVQQVTAIVQSFTPAMMGEDFIPVVPISIPSSSFVNHTNRCGNNNGLLMLATMAEVAAANYAA